MGTRLFIAARFTLHASAATPTVFDNLPAAQTTYCDTSSPKPSQPILNCEILLDARASMLAKLRLRCALIDADTHAHRARNRYLLQVNPFDAGGARFVHCIEQRLHVFNQCIDSK